MLWLQFISLYNPIMIQFIKDAFTELEHIVWPTPTESKNYMIYTVGTIVVLGVFLAVMAFAIRSGLVFTRNQFPHDMDTTQTVSGESDIDTTLDKVLIKNKSKEQTISTGAIVPDTVSTGAAN